MKLQTFQKHFVKSIIAICSIILFFMFVIASIPPKNFPNGQIDVHISDNSSLSIISDGLANKNIIKSPFLFKIGVVIFGGQKGLFAGDYRFTKPQNSLIVAYRMVKGHQGLPKVKITIPEGTNSYDMAYLYLTKFPNFNAPKFLALALQNEGYLFPDTYYFLSNVKPEEVIKTMRNNFNAKTLSIKSYIESSDKILDEIIIMASIVEEEAKSSEDRRMVAGILWKRLKEGIPLQVDPPFYYITGKTNGVTYDDLKIDSPYNTYRNKGLPKGPISNPGLDAILATLKPIESTHYFYLTGRDGEMKYADTFDGHIRNKNVYLK